EIADDNTALGEFVLSGLPPAPSGEPKLAVAFDLDVNSILKVSAKDQVTGNEKEIIVNARVGLTEEQIEQLIAEAKENAEQDAARKKLVEIRNAAASEINRARMLLRNFPDQLSAQKEDVGKQIKALERELERSLDVDNRQAIDNIVSMTKKLEELLSF
ncbi:MAG: Hsp70 family protein, partial [Chloroflexi bacterium]|nr:Hsp70 family protein [Chloroflexota bacterium]